ncbi:cysteine desulfurase family protein [Vibrio sp. ECSMB14106]|uniref:cysteine desulfurase family protein n=1 Tax=Vibrio sp. ECSMB14106 TaxID=1638949 RepID=UPI00061935D8|nr:cysteine desulfurase family protein [Vibrio sp. ECSMB14106]
MNNYFDYAASTPVSNAVKVAMQPWQDENFANPSSVHIDGESASKAIQEAREIIADKIGAMPSEIIFTSGASESNNLAIKGIAFQHLESKGHIITSSIEHKCVLSTCAFLETIGFEVSYIEPNEHGLIDISAVEQSLKSNTLLISIHHVNNELGIVQPIEEIGELAFEHGIPFHTDVAQSFCKFDIDVDDMNIEMLSLSGHKIYGPKGVGVLYVRDARYSDLVPLIHGGGQELGIRGGTSPTPLIVGLGEAVGSFPIRPSVQQLEFENLIQSYQFTRNGGDRAVPTIWNVTFSDDNEVKRFTKKYNWLISQGSACNAISNVPSHVLSAIGLSEEEARRTYRISLPPYYINS